MRKLISWIAMALTCAVLGIAQISAPEKPYDNSGYYSGLVSQEEPDYQSIYKETNKYGLVSLAECNKSARPIPMDKAVYVPLSNKYGFSWFWAVSDNKSHKEYLSKYDAKSNLKGYQKVDGTNMFLWELDESDKYLVAIGNATIVAKSQQPDRLYPTDKTTRGTKMSIIVKSLEFKTAFKITYGSMERWFCCLDKKKPDNGDTAKPRYSHSISFSDSDKLYSGNLVGLAGKSGMPAPKSNKVYLTIEIERCTLDDSGNLNEDWKNVTDLKDVYAS